MNPESATRWISRAAAAGFLLAAVVLGLAGYHFYQLQREAVLREVRTQLDITAQLKVEEMSAWRQARLTDARMLLGDEPLLRAMRSVIQGRATAGEREDARRWMAVLCEGSQYANAILLGWDGREALRIGPLYGSPAHFRALLAELGSGSGVQLRDLHAERGTEKFHLGLNIALRTRPGESPFGALALAVDPERFLFPMLDRWPLSTYEGETLLVRRQGNEAFFLNRSDPARGSASRLRLPLSQSALVVVQGLQGRNGIMSGMDRRGREARAAGLGLAGGGRGR
jgi:hypothetical protein